MFHAYFGPFTHGNSSSLTGRKFFYCLQMYRFERVERKCTRPSHEMTINLALCHMELLPILNPLDKWIPSEGSLLFVACRNLILGYVCGRGDNMRNSSHDLILCVNPCMAQKYAVDMTSCATLC